LAEKYDCGHLNKEGDKSGSMHVCCTSCFVLRRTRQRLHRHSTSALGFPSALTEPAHPIPRHLDSLSWLQRWTRGGLEIADFHLFPVLCFLPAVDAHAQPAHSRLTIWPATPPLYDDLRWIPLPSHNGAVFGARYKSRVLCVLGMPATVWTRLGSGSLCEFPLSEPTSGSAAPTVLNNAWASGEELWSKVMLAALSSWTCKVR